MPSPDAPVDRRRQRSVRIVVAVCLLSLATVVVLGGLLTRSALWLGGAAVVAWAAGVAASRIISNELAASRREHGRDRAEQVRAYNELAEQRAAEQDRFTATMRQRVEDHASTINRLRATLRLAEKRAEFAEQTADRNKVTVAKAHKEIAELKARIVELETGIKLLRDRTAESAESIYDLEALEGLGEVPTVVDLLEWDERAYEPAEQRRQA